MREAAMNENNGARMKQATTQELESIPAQRAKQRKSRSEGGCGHGVDELCIKIVSKPGLQKGRHKEEHLSILCWCIAPAQERILYSLTNVLQAGRQATKSRGINRHTGCPRWLRLRKLPCHQQSAISLCMAHAHWCTICCTRAHCLLS